MLKVSAAASVVSQSLGDLLQHVRQYTSRGEPIGRYDQATDTIMTVTENIFSSMGDAGESKRGSEMNSSTSSHCGNFFNLVNLLEYRKRLNYVEINALLFVIK